MATSTIEGSGTQLSGRVEKTAATATAAIVVYHEIRRQCGKYGSVEILGEKGRPMTLT
jgi:hypothetical protein